MGHGEAMSFNSGSEPQAFPSPTRTPDAPAACQIALGKAHSLALTLGRHGAQVSVFGEIDMIAAADLDRLLASLDSLMAPVEVDLSQVTFLDSHGVRPVIEASRRRSQLGLPALAIIAASRPARRLLQVAGIGGNPTLDVPAWDRSNGVATAASWRKAAAAGPRPTATQEREAGGVPPARPTRPDSCPRRRVGGG